MSGRTGRRRLGVLVAAGALALVACGIPTDDAPRPLAEGTGSTQAPTASAPTSSANEATLYLSEERGSQVLAPVVRKLKGPPSTLRVLTALLAGPTGDDRVAGYTTLIPRETTLVGATIVDARVVIELSEEWATLRGETALGAYAQVVLTITELAGIESVQFVDDGVVVPAPTTVEDDKDVVTRADYSTLDPTMNGAETVPATSVPDPFLPPG